MDDTITLGELAFWIARLVSIGDFEGMSALVCDHVRRSGGCRALNVVLLRDHGIAIDVGPIVPVT